MELILRPWKLYADAKGRSSRAEFWLFYLIKYVMFFLMFFLLALTLNLSQPDHNLSAFGLALIIWLLITLVPTCVLLVRRCHDFDATGKWALTTFIPYIGFPAVAVIGFIPGTKGENTYGFEPGEPEIDAIAETFQ